jgi:triosephosphate isomerase
VWSHGNTADVVVAPPFIYIDQVKNSLTGRIEVSAQNVWIGKGGAYTGEIRLGAESFLLLSFLYMEIAGLQLLVQ